MNTEQIIILGILISVIILYIIDYVKYVSKYCNDHVIMPFQIFVYLVINFMIIMMLLISVIEINNLRKGCPEYEKIEEPIYRLKSN